jgi:glycerol-3-phosphate acyltransferase PlsY
MFLALAPLALAIALPVWALVLWLTGYVSVASLTAAGTFPLWVVLTKPGATATFWAAVVLAALIFITHRANIRRLLAGTENRFRTRGRAGGTGTA